MLKTKKEHNRCQCHVVDENRQVLAGLPCLYIVSVLLYRSSFSAFDTLVYACWHQ